MKRSAWLFAAGLVLGVALAHGDPLLVGLGLVAGLALRGLPRWRKPKRATQTHPCSQCGSPIDGRSRAAYCCPACRDFARLAREQRERRAELLAQSGQVPF